MRISISSGNRLRVRSRPGKPNQRKADSQAGSRIWGVLVNSECFSRKKHSEFTKIGAEIPEPACESAFLWFGCWGDS